MLVVNVRLSLPKMPNLGIGAPTAKSPVSAGYHVRNGVQIKRTARARFARDHSHSMHDVEIAGPTELLPWGIAILYSHDSPDNNRVDIWPEEASQPVTH